MLDIKLVRENPNLVKENLRRRGTLDKVPEVDRLLELDNKWRQFLQETEALRRKRNEITQEIAKARSKKEDASLLLRQAEQIPEQIKKIEGEADRIKDIVEQILLNLPNLVDPSVPFGKDDNDNVEVKRWGEPPRFPFKPLDDIILADRLPLKYAAISPCFRKEAGAHGRDTKGIFRVHQFEKVEQFIFSRPEDSWKLHEELLANLEEFFQSLKIPYRIVNVCTGDLGTVAAKKYDLEAWLPGQGKYREMASCSNCTSYQSVRSKVRYREKTSEPTKYPHTLNSTLVATERAIVAILENNQKEDGTVTVPNVLQSYMNGQEQIPTK